MLSFLVLVLPTIWSRHHCSPPMGSIQSDIRVQDGRGNTDELTTLSWQLALGSTLCYRCQMKYRVRKFIVLILLRFRSPEKRSHGTVEVSFVSLKSIYPILESYNFPLVRSSVTCTCDCPGGASYCDLQASSCGNKTNCVDFFNPSISSNGCLFSFLKIPAAICCSLQVT